MNHVPDPRNNGGRPQTAPIRTGVTVSVPSRSAISVFDMNTFAPGQPGGGNSGFALSIYTRIVIRRRSAGNGNSEHNDRSDQRVLFDHCAATWAQRVGETGPFDLEVLETPLQHVGLASSSAFQAASYAGLNWLDGMPLSEPQLLDLLYSSYKEVVDGQLVKGFTTGLSGFLNLYGGFVALDTDLRPLQHFPLPAWNYVVAMPRGWASSAFGEDEVKLLMGDGKRLDKQDRDEKRRLLNDAILPALKKQNLREFGQAVYRVQQLGNKRCEILLHGERMDTTLEQLSATGVECIFLSAVGPAIVMLSETSLGSLAPLLEKLELDVSYSGKIDNTGLVLSDADIETS